MLMITAIESILRKINWLLLILILVLCQNAWSQTLPATKLSGRVTGKEEGTALNQVSVQNIVTGKGVFTDALGTYTIDVRRGDSIQFSYTGKGTRTIAYKGQPTINVELSNAEEKVYGGTFIFSSIMAFVFSGLTYLFI